MNNAAIDMLVCIVSCAEMCISVEHLTKKYLEFYVQYMCSTRYIFCKDFLFTFGVLQFYFFNGAF